MHRLLRSKTGVHAAGPFSRPLPCQLRLALHDARFSNMAALVAVFVLMVAPVASANVVTEWLAADDPPERCLALVVLNGEHPNRADEAVRLYRAGFGREVWLTDDPKSSDPDGDAGTRSNRKHLIAQGIPPAAIRAVPGAATSTRAELEAVAATMRGRTATCAVLVTSPLHVRRVRVTWQRVIGEAPRAVVRGTTGSDYRATSKELALTLLALLGRPR